MTTLKLITKSEEAYREACEYCKEHGLKINGWKAEYIKGYPDEWYFDITGTRRQIEQYEDDNIIVY